MSATFPAVADLEDRVLAVLRQDGPRTAAQVAEAIGASEHLARVAIALLARRCAVTTAGHRLGEPDVLRRRPVLSLWRAA